MKKRQSRVASRITLEERKELEALSTLNGLSLSDLVRVAVVGVIAHCKKHKGIIKIPIDLDE